MISILLHPLTLLLSVQLAQASLRAITTSTTRTATNNKVVVDWNNPTTTTTKTSVTLQVVTNPILNRKISPVAPQLFQNLNLLQADLVRYAAWYPYPQYSVAELSPPNYSTNTSYWYFSEEFKQQFLDVFHAVTDNPDKRLLINFSTQPTWMFGTDTWEWDPDPNRVDWNYVKGGVMENTTQKVAEYYGRLASWIIKGEFVDEFGKTITGGPALGDKVTHWEVFNEPEAEHKIVNEQYNGFFDAIVREVRKQADPDHRIQFVGMAVAYHKEWEFWETFLTPSKHDEDVRDAVASGMASFHFYASASSRTNISTYVETFRKIPGFLDEVDHVLQLRQSLNPTTRLFVNEAGVILPGDTKPGVEAPPPIYYNMVAAYFTVLFAELSVKGVDAVGSSQFCGIPAIPEWGIPDTQYPSVSMTNWTTGAGNPRYWALKLILEHFGPGDQILQTSTVHQNDEDVFVQARITNKQKKRAMIVVNKSLQQQSVEIKGLVNAAVYIVDEETHDQKWKEMTWNSETLTLMRFGVAVVVFADTELEAEGDAMIS